MSEDAMLEREAKRRGISVTELKMIEAVPDKVIRDIVSDGRRGISQSQSMIAARSEAQPTRRSDKGWVEPRPLQPPPGISLVDKLCDAQDARERAGRRGR